MKILHICETVNKGGACIAGFRLHSKLIEKNIDSHFLYKEGLSSYENSHKIPFHKLLLGKLYNLINSILQFLFFGRTKSSYFSKFSFLHISLNKEIQKINPDIVQIHWMSPSFLNLRELLKLKIPVIFNLHDFKAFSSGCYYPNVCQESLNIDCCYTKNNDSNCSNKIGYQCQTLESIKVPFIYKMYIKNRLKLISNSKGMFYYVGPSNWIVKECKKSIFIQKKENCFVIPNILNSTISSKTITKKYKIKKQKKIVLFAVASSINDPRKGFKYVLDVSRRLSSKIEFWVIGKNENNIKLKGIHFLGHDFSQKKMLSILRKIDFAFVPSLQENFSNLIFENLINSKPVIAFNIGGNSDLIKHKHNGYLIPSKNIEDIINGFLFIMKKDNLDLLSKNCFNSVNEKFNSDFVLEKWIKFYKEVYANH